MSSGYGLTGGPGRCFPFWQEMLACYVVNTNSEDGSGKKKCAPMLEDYYECLHHRKEHQLQGRLSDETPKQAARVHALQSAYRKHIAANPRDDAPSAGQIRSLGLIEGDLHEKDMKAAALLPHVKTN
ncbi:hypothetical protein E4T50_13628 [Aureobasidium sp. EXF-12298]|nr:hypothetical protein E4T50_13628 [Aureobasidium sp. EXF-12298]